MGWDLEETEDQEEDEEVVDAQGEFDNVSGDELEGGGAAVPEENDDGEDGGQGDPGHAPDQGLAELDGVGAAVEHTQVEPQHGEDEKIK